MSADFWAGYVSGAIGIVIGNPLDILKVRLQAGGGSSSSSSSSSSSLLPTPIPNSTPSPPPSAAAAAAAAAAAPPTTSGTPSTTSWIRPFLRGTAAPVLGYGALNALLFVSYNRTESAINHFVFGIDPSLPLQTGVNLWSTWIAGAVGGLATWVVSTPTELIKCRVQLAAEEQQQQQQQQGQQGSRRGTIQGSSSSSSRRRRRGGIGIVGTEKKGSSSSSWQVTKHVLRTQGIKGLYFGGAVTALRDSIGYGFYFWSYELSSRWMVAAAAASSSSSSSSSSSQAGGILTSEATRVLLCGGLAGIITWASIFPLDVIKTRVQTQGILPLPLASGSGVIETQGEQTALLDRTASQRKQRPLGAWEVAKLTYREGGVKPFFRGLAVCSVRAFIVNAVQWAMYEWIMTELGQGRRAKASGTGGVEAETLGGGELAGMGAA
ncbi:solute carrier family 25 protein [Neurospora crassa OR74A]|uniref:Solute carrier family 25 protein n=1 Tax=Neurospora crassa (strain ATCC 24698 / 74-OR23-1A / CBS 708.71 / DSM 1257 / FGSC 987) TaxID=367110 RepID=Q7S4X3_NEUCR|nr:solute carrier family 25 protein [Neurospora crassa OR74A]EAA30537.1 solute carrier family 25 protein [Neurospora crassa OR74A]|eukprot:XP_959773.1 solute carrier family 25 protein [Neurospora crassa OR74A]